MWIWDRTDDIFWGKTHIYRELRKTKAREKMNKKIKALVLLTAIAAIGAVIALFAYAYFTGPPATPPPKFEKVELKTGKSAMVKGNLIKLVSIEKEKGIVKIEVQNETTGKPMVVPLKFYGAAFKYRNISIIPLPDTIKNDRITFLIAEVAYSGADTQSP